MRSAFLFLLYLIDILKLYDLGSSPLLLYTHPPQVARMTTSSLPARTMPPRTLKLLWMTSRRCTSASRAMTLYLRRGNWSPISNRHAGSHVSVRNGFLWRSCENSTSGCGDENSRQARAQFKQPLVNFVPDQTEGTSEYK